MFFTILILFELFLLLFYGDLCVYACFIIVIGGYMFLVSSLGFVLCCIC